MNFTVVSVVCIRQVFISAITGCVGRCSLDDIDSSEDALECSVGVTVLSVDAVNESVGQNAECL